MEFIFLFNFFFIVLKAKKNGKKQIVSEHNFGKIKRK